jgi:hypothetical protein
LLDSKMLGELSEEIDATLRSALYALEAFKEGQGPEEAVKVECKRIDFLMNTVNRLSQSLNDAAAPVEDQEKLLGELEKMNGRIGYFPNNACAQLAAHKHNKHNELAELA